MSTQALEFAATISPSLVASLNRNPRKFRILQMKFDEDGFLPVVVGTYAVDAITGQALGQNVLNLPKPNFENAQGPVNTNTITLVPNGTITKECRIYVIQFMVGGSTNALLQISSTTIWAMTGLAANILYTIDFGTFGYSLADLGQISILSGGSGNIALNFSASTTCTGNILAYVA